MSLDEIETLNMENGVPEVLVDRRWPPVEVASRCGFLDKRREIRSGSKTLGAKSRVPRMPPLNHNAS